jgi:phenylacetate-CoA ligase
VENILKMFINNKKIMIPDIETKPLNEIKIFQEMLLRTQLEYNNKYSKYYSRMFYKKNIDIRRIKTLEDLQSLPVTTKHDWQEHNSDFYCVDKSKVIDYITTSGTAGEPVTFIMTDKDLDRLAYNEAISLSCSDGTTDDIFQIATTLDRRFMAGMAYFLGVRKIGAGVVRVGNGIPEFQWDTIKRISPTAIIIVPSFLLKLVEFAEENGIDYQSSSIKKAVCIGEPLRDPALNLNIIGKKIIEKWKIKLYSTYASTEMSTAFNECSYGVGCHHHPELIITEFLDENDIPVKAGEPGELTITTLGVEGMPLLRFKTGDVCYYMDEPCQCGRFTIRLSPVIGRKQQMIKYKGTTLYPNAFYEILNSIAGIENYVIEVFTNENDLDEILIHIGTKQDPVGFDENIKNHFRAKLRVSPQLVFEPVEVIEKIINSETGRKAINFIDRRNSNKSF